MADGMSFDFSELDKLAADLGEVPKNIGPFVRKATEVSARKVRDGWRDNARGLAHAPAFPSSITYDLKGGNAVRGSQIDADIGPDKGRAQGALGNLIEYGSVNNPPQGLGQKALQANQEDFVTGLGRAEDDARKKGNL
jgi:hypothetical protein